jgi:predicted PurR-regulated permease PerM
MNEYTTFPQNNNPNSNPNSQLVITLNRHSIRTIIKLIFGILVLFLVIRLLPFVKSLLAPMVISFVLAFLLKPLVNKLENAGISRGPAVLMLFLIFGAIIEIGIKLLLPGLSQEFNTLAQTVQKGDPESLIAKIQVTLSQRISFLKNPEIAREVSTKLHNFFTSLLSKSFNLIFKIISSFTYIIIVPFITFFVLKDGRRMKKFIIQLVPNRYFEMSLNLLYKTNAQLGNYIRGQLLVASIVGVLSVIALYSLDIPYFFVIGAAAGMANMIPYFGPVVGALPGVLAALIEKGSLESVLGVIVAFALIHLMDNILFSPIIVSKSVQIHPLLVIIVILVGGNIGGILGMLVAVPVFAVAQVFVTEIAWSFRHYRLTE